MGKNSFPKHLDEYHKERKSFSFLGSKGFKAILNFVRDLIRTGEFQKLIIEEREDRSIPQSGFHREPPGPWTHPPREWSHYKNRKVILQKIRGGLKKFCLKHNLLPRDWAPVFEQFLFYGELNIPLEPNAYNLCFVSDLRSKTDSTGRQTTDEDISVYPVALHISPYASKRNILDYVEKFYATEIARLQKGYRDPGAGIGKHKTKNKIVRKISDFIYEHRNLKPKEIKKLLWEKLHTQMDSGHISKILSLERKRRK